MATFFCLHVSKYRGALVSRKCSSVICFDGHVGAKVTGSISYIFTQEERETTEKVGVKTQLM